MKKFILLTIATCFLFGSPIVGMETKNQSKIEARLCNDVLHIIFSFLDFSNFLNMRTPNKYFKNFIETKALPRNLTLKITNKDTSKTILPKLAFFKNTINRHPITKVTFENLGNPKLLKNKFNRVGLELLKFFELEKGIAKKRAYPLFEKIALIESINELEIIGCSKHLETKLLEFFANKGNNTITKLKLKYSDIPEKDSSGIFHLDKLEGFKQLQELEIVSLRGENIGRCSQVFLGWGSLKKLKALRKVSIGHSHKCSLENLFKYISEYHYHSSECGPQYCFHCYKRFLESLPSEISQIKIKGFEIEKALIFKTIDDKKHLENFEIIVYIFDKNFELSDFISEIKSKYKNSEIKIIQHEDKKAFSEIIITIPRNELTLTAKIFTTLRHKENV